MKLSIVVTTHNNHLGLDKTLDSIMRFCGVKDTEILIVDNSNNKESFDIFRKYYNTLKSHISYIRVMGNTINDLRNTGLLLACGDYILFLMNGDTIRANFIPRATSYLDKYNYGMYVTSYFDEEEVKYTPLFNELGIGPMLCNTVIRRSLIVDDFHWGACGDNIFTGILLNRGVKYHVEEDIAGIYYDEKSYGWIIDEGSAYLESIDEDWLDYVRRQIGLPNLDISVHVTNRCNKNCVSCGHFAPLVPSDDPDLTPDEFRMSMESLSVHKDMVNRLILTGGEPTINPHCMDIIRIAHEYFPHVRLVSNGFNLKFFEQNAQELKELGTQIYITNYSNSIIEKLDKYIDRSGYTIPALENDNEERIYFWSGMLANGTVEHPELIGGCGRGCSQLVGTKLYICQYTANFRFFDEYFKGEHNLPDVEDSYIDLSDKTVTDRDIKEFVYNKVCKLCSHCREHLTNHSLIDDLEKVELKNSDLKIEEWIRG